MAVGDRPNAKGVARTLIQSRNGSAWSIVPSPNHGSNANVLNGVSCASRKFCVAVGYYEKASGTQQTLIETWNGTAWALTSSPDVTSGDNYLNGVSCVDSATCMAVGAYPTDQQMPQVATLAEYWNGSFWSITSTQSPAAGNILSAVSCAVDVCVAVGVTASSGFTDTLAEVWNDSTWSLSSSPSPGDVENSLNDVSCTSGPTCTAVGYYEGPSRAQTLVESWDGSWSVVSSPNKGSEDDLNGVSCTASSDCVAVGDYTARKSGAIDTLIEAWNGASWSVTPSPNAAADNELFGASCTSTSKCVAIGSYQNSSGVLQTLILTGTAAPLAARRV